MARERQQREHKTFVFYSPQRVADPQAGFKITPYGGAMLDWLPVV